MAKTDCTENYIQAGKPHKFANGSLPILLCKMPKSIGHFGRISELYYGWAAAAEVFNSFLILRIVARLIWLNPIEQKNTVIERFGLFSVWMLRYKRNTSELNAAVAELVDAQRWGRCGVTPVEVRVFSAAPTSTRLEQSSGV